MSTSAPERIEVASDVLVADLDGESVLLSMSNDRYYGLDDVASRMWHLLAEHGEVEKVVGLLLEEYEVDEPELRRHLAELIEKLAGMGLLTVEQSS